MCQQNFETQTSRYIFFENTQFIEKEINANDFNVHFSKFVNNNYNNIYCGSTFTETNFAKVE